MTKLLRFQTLLSKILLAPLPLEYYIDQRNKISIESIY